jgi:hypothetical protein
VPAGSAARLLQLREKMKAKIREAQRKKEKRSE